MQNLARFLEEDLAHLVVFGQVDRHRPADAVGLGSQRRRSRFQAYKPGSGGDEVDQRLGQLLAGNGEVGSACRALDGVARFQHGGGERRLIGHTGLLRQAFEVARNVFKWNVVTHRREGEHLRLLEQARLDRRCGQRGSGERALVLIAETHHRAERA